jgi:hypothetical protein
MTVSLPAQVVGRAFDGVIAHRSARLEVSTVARCRSMKAQKLTR